MIFNPERHEPTTSKPWNERLARFAIRDIVDEVVEAGPPEDLATTPPACTRAQQASVYALRMLGSDVDWPLGAGKVPG